jgi:cytochrome c5
MLPAAFRAALFGPAAGGATLACNLLASNLFGNLRRNRRDTGWIVRNYDLDFLKKFSLVIGFLAALTLGLILFARHLHHAQPQPADPTAAARVHARIAPAGAVYAGATGAAAQAAAAIAAAKAAASQVAYGGTLDGAVIYNNLCAGCHTSGAGGAPMLTAAGMGARVGKGKDLLYQHAIEGFTGSAGVMPAKGGNAGLTDAQVTATVDWMLANLK